MNDDLDLAREFIKHGVPVFIAKRNAQYNADDKDSGPEFHFPRGWPEFEPDPKALDGWTPDHAVCAVTGVHFDVIDVDPRNGGFESLVTIIKAGLLPPTYGEIATPSDGFHLYVARTGRAKGTPVEGIDLQAGDGAGNGRGFVYIPPTVRPSKVTGLPASYSVVDKPSIAQCKANVDHPDAEMFLRFLYVKMPPKVEQPTAAAWVPRQHTDREARYLETAVTGLANEVAQAPEGMRNNTLNAKAYRAGQLIAGCGAPERWVWQVMTIAANAAGLKPSESAATMKSAIAKGKRKPITVGPFVAENNQQTVVTAADLDEFIAWQDDIITRLAQGETKDGTN